MSNTLTRTGGMTIRHVDQEWTEKLLDDLREQAADWFCLRVEPWRCDNCGGAFRYHMHPGENGEHLVIVWPARDDPNMYRAIGERDGKAAIVPFEDSIGPAVSFYELVPS